jgi:hypothetical protein
MVEYQIVEGKVRTRALEYHIADHCNPNGVEARSPDARETADLKRAKHFDRVVFCAGEAVHSLLEAALAESPLPFAFEIDVGGITRASAEPSAFLRRWVGVARSRSIWGRRNSR